MGCWHHRQQLNPLCPSASSSPVISEREREPWSEIGSRLCHDNISTYWVLHLWPEDVASSSWGGRQDQMDVNGSAGGLQVLRNQEHPVLPKKKAEKAALPPAYGSRTAGISVCVFLHFYAGISQDRWDQWLLQSPVRVLSLYCTFCSMERPHRGQKEPRSDPSVGIRQSHFSWESPSVRMGLILSFPPENPTITTPPPKGWSPVLFHGRR